MFTIRHSGCDFSSEAMSDQHEIMQIIIVDYVHNILNRGLHSNIL